MSKKPLLNLLSQLLTGRWIDLTLIAFAVMAWGATFLLLVRGMIQLSPNTESATFMAGAITFFAIAWFLKKYSGRNFVERIEYSSWKQITFLIVLGIVLRLVWVILFPAAPSSDGATYIALANKLLDEGSFEVAGTYAYWPPGYPLFLMVWLFALPTVIAVPLSQITLYIVGAIGVFRLTKHIASKSAGIVALLLITIWPNLIALSSTPEKEVLIFALLPWLFFWVLRGSSKGAIFAGISLGLTVLAQPSLQLLIPALALVLIIRNGLKSIPNAVLLIIGAFLVIAPWSIRNFQVLGEFKLVATNGGYVLYRANNPLATGGYTERGEVDLSKLNELDLDRKSKELAVRWIRENPAKFAHLAVEKQIRFMGDDAVGIYSTFRADGEKRDSRLYLPLKLLANIWWLSAWLLLALLVLKGRKLKNDARILVWGWIYLFVIHSVFESAGKYHVPMLWVLCVVLGILITNNHQIESTVKAN